MKRTTNRRKPETAGFTLIELLVVVAILTLLASLSVTGLFRSIELAKRTRCASNLRQLYLANLHYAVDEGQFVAAASDLFGANLKRWHGQRPSLGKPFDGQKGPLAEYLGGGSAEIRRCPSFVDYQNRSGNAFEASCGGYGYNARGVGSRSYIYGQTAAGAKLGMAPEDLKTPSRTVMFCDTAFPQPYGAPEYLIEYSFAESYHFVSGQPPRETSAVASPSIHFRHLGCANVAWCDGHVSHEVMTIRPADDQFTRFNMGWFGPPDNSLFDPF